MKMEIIEAENSNGLLKKLRGWMQAFPFEVEGAKPSIPRYLRFVIFLQLSPKQIL
jgi:hypothetical protein